MAPAACRPIGVIPLGMTTRRTLLLVDGYAAIFRAYYAIRSLSTRDGRPTNAVYGSVRTLNGLRERWRRTHWAMVLDGGIPEEQLEALEWYKADREEMPETLEEQMDDTVRIATRDKELFQLANDRVRIVPLGKEGAAVGPREVRENFGVPPDRLPALLALAEDPVDRIPGVPGIGLKTAAGLIRRYGTLEQLWEALDELPSTKIRGALRRHRAEVERNLDLVRWYTDEAVTLRWRRLQCRSPEPGALLSFFAFMNCDRMAETGRQQAARQKK